MIEKVGQPKEMSRMQLMFRALQHRNFRLFFMGQSISLLGIWMQMTAVAWLVWRLDNLRRMIRPIYVRKGIIPEVATGLQSASSVNQP